MVYLVPMNYALALLLLAASQDSPDPLKTGHANRNREFTSWMKATGAANGALSRLETKTGKDATEKAEALGSIYENMIGFWRQAGAPDAVKLSIQGKAAALELAAAAHSGDAPKAAEAYAKLATTCKACHDVHRNKLADGTYLMLMPIRK